MPTFDTPTPVWVTIELAVGDANVIAGDRTDTVVDVRPGDESAGSAEAAERTLVDYSKGQLVVKSPKRRGLFGKQGSIDVTVEVPSGSHLRGDAAEGSFRCEGRFGDCHLKTASGDVTVDHADGHVDVRTWSGDVRISGVGGHALVKNGNGTSWIGHVAGDLRLSTSNGDLSVDRAESDVMAKTADGSIRLGEVANGSVELSTASGDIEVGIAEGTAAWLDVTSWSGNVNNLLESTNEPEPSDRTVKVHASTYEGDIVIRRS